MKKILIPLDGTERSMSSIGLVKEYYKPEEIQLTLMYVKEDAQLFIDEKSFAEAESEMQKIVCPAVQQLEGYQINCEVGFVDPGKEIVKYAISNKIDIIVMTKSTKKGLTRMIGSVTSYVVKHTPCITMIVPE